MSVETQRSSSLRDWAGLVRLPNVFTVIADVAAAFLLVALGPEPIARFVTVIAAGVALYWAGMILNDVFDVAKDREERPLRPLPSEKISLRHARTAGWLFLVLGVVLGAVSGFLPTGGRELETTALPALVAFALAVMIVLYNGPLKKTPLAPVAMGSCRVLSFLLGASPLVSHSGGLFPHYIVVVALGFGIYVMGLTTMGRHEAVGGRSPNLSTGLVVLIIGCALLAIAPRLAVGVMGWHVSPQGAFPILIGLIALPVILRGIRLLMDPSAAKIQAAMRAGILSIIPFAAAFAFLGAGPFWGLGIFALVFPAIALSFRMSVT